MLVIDAVVLEIPKITSAMLPVASSENGNSLMKFFIKVLRDFIKMGRKKLTGDIYTATY
jgi:hypothetical protein